MLNLQVRQVLQIGGYRTIKKKTKPCEKSYVEEWIFKADMSTLIYKEFSKQTYMTQIVF